MENNDFSFLNKVLLSHIWLYVQKHLDNNDGEVPETLMKMKTNGYNYRVINPFSDEQICHLKRIEKDPVFIKIKEQKISYLIMAARLLELWVDDIEKKKRPSFNISDKRLKAGKTLYALHMVKAKINDPELYKDEKKIIDETISTADEWYQYFKEQDKLIYEGLKCTQVLI